MCRLLCKPLISTPGTHTLALLHSAYVTSDTIARNQKDIYTGVVKGGVSLNLNGPTAAGSLLSEL